MKIFKYFVAFFLLATFHAGAQESPKERIIILNGHFFKELPPSIKNAPTPQDMKIFMLSTPKGARAIGMLTATELSNNTVKHAIPAEQVFEGKELLRRFNEAIENSNKRISTMSETKPTIEIGDKFPKFSATDIDGKKWTNEDVEGKIMVLNLWYTGCGPCRAEMPELSTWKDEMPDVMFFSSTYESPDVARQVLDKVEFNWTHLVNDIQFKEFIGDNGYPFTMIIGKDGKIAAFEYGTSPAQRASLKQKIQSLR